MAGSHISMDFNAPSTRASGVHWLCVDRTRGCEGAVITQENNQQPRVSVQRMHPPDPALAQVSNFRAVLKKTARETNGTPSAVCEEVLHNLQESARARVSAEEILKRGIRRQRSSLYPPTSASLTDFDIDGAWTTTRGLSLKEFLIYDNWPQARFRIN